MFRFWSSAILNLELPSLFGISHQQKESTNRSKAQLKVTVWHNKIQQKREAYQWWVANKLIKKYDAVAAEDLPTIENMMKRCQPIKSNSGGCLPNNRSAKRGLNRSLSDASWYDLTKKLEYLAASQEKDLIKLIHNIPAKLVANAVTSFEIAAMGKSLFVLIADRLMMQIGKLQET